ncbi:Polypyrimidine tract-binding protein 2 [Cyphomyrmex costatus]|uniref:Polypyrimidine tract-binding protein 2 n=1 Tax=Cyphomyrmex costatus TaxID=456900 RepID=A0A195D4K2_9HYME|nr:Polypyrimidine tract-binding protein 2 [Cyphomyrmex costatus]
MRKMPVVGEPMGIETTEKLWVGTPGGDPTILVSAPTFPIVLYLSAFPRLSQHSSLPLAESYKSSKADRSVLYHVTDIERAPRFLDGKMLGSSWPGRRRTADNPGSQRVSCPSRPRSESQARSEKGDPGIYRVSRRGDYRILVVAKHAFLEMADENAAATMVTYYASGVAQLRGRAVYVQFSNHRELKTDQTHSNNAVSSPTNDVANTSENSNNQVAIAGQNQVSGPGETQGGPNTVLRVIVEHLLYPITLDILYSIFTRYGKVLKIVTFTKNSSFQALIQYSDMLAAQTAKFALDGQNVYNSCCTLRIDYSKMQNLNVKYNNDKSRDYTNPNLPTGDASLDAASLALGGELLLMGAGSQPRARIPESIAGAPGVLPTPFAMHGLASPLAGPYNGVPPAGGLAGLGGFPLGAAGLGVRVQGSAQASAVLLVSNLNEEMVTPDALFTLFAESLASCMSRFYAICRHRPSLLKRTLRIVHIGVYGDVQRVKILYNKKDSALIQMAEPHQALLALTHMDKLRVFGKQIKVMLSKHQTVQLPKEGQPDAGLTKDYTNSTLHRFKKPGSKNYQNIYPPSSTLHLSNIPATVAEEEIKDAFTKNGFTVKAFKFFPKDRKMALIQMPNMDDAVAALIVSHHCCSQ